MDEFQADVVNEPFTMPQPDSCGLLDHEGLTATFH